MKRIVLLDTWTNNANLGNRIIFESVYSILLDLFPDSFIYQVSALERVNAGRDLLEKADLILLSGTNQLSSNMDETSEWCAEPTEQFWMNKVILFGVGWWQYQDYEPNEYTRNLLSKTLSTNFYHSVRDAYTAERLGKLGFQVYNTGCPTLWNLTTRHCQSIPQSKSDIAVLTFTEYNQQPEYDQILFEIVRRNYSKIFFWPQQYIDYFYAKEICGDQIEMLPPNTRAFDQLLEGSNVDYIGTRLHAGIRALQKKKRAIVIAIDNRSIEISRDFNLPLVQRQNLSTDLEPLINSSWTTHINIESKTEINLWKNQFREVADGIDSCGKPEPVWVGRWALNYYRTSRDNSSSLTLQESKHLDENLQKNSVEDVSELKELYLQIEKLTQSNFKKKDRIQRLKKENQELKQKIAVIDKQSQQLHPQVKTLRFRNRLRRLIETFFK